MPGRNHERIIGSFGALVLEYLMLMGLSIKNGDFVDQRSTRTPGATCSKEPDWWFGPHNVWVDRAEDEKPSLILEVGLSEPSNQLRNDARWWYANMQRETKLVVLIHVCRNPAYKVIVEVWTEVDHPRPGPATRARPSTTIECTQRAEYQNGVVQGAPLTLNFKTLMRRPPQNSMEHDIILDANDLALICFQRT
jgi:hypothetical protein